jgi:hypothetical protein
MAFNARPTESEKEEVARQSLIGARIAASAHVHPQN